MKITPVAKVSGLSREEFAKDYLNPLKPVVFKDLSIDWPARDKWTFDYLIQNYGHLDVPLYDEGYTAPGKGYMTSTKSMKFGEYLQLIREQPTTLRMFLFNIFKHAPELAKDVPTPTIMDGFLKEFPFMFFGGQGSVVNTHYDIDCSHVFLTQFQTKKRVLLFPQEEGKNLYHLPFTVTTLVNFKDPDVKKWPALKNVRGYECILEHGETLFIPSMYWHYIEYVEGGFSIALRSSSSIQQKVKGVYNIAQHYLVDKGMNALLGERWKYIKEDIAQKRAIA